MPRVRLNRPTIDGCRFVLNAHVLRANGCLHPGWSGKWSIGESIGEGSSGGDKSDGKRGDKGGGKGVVGGAAGGAGKAKVSIHLRVERSGGGADRLHLRWDRQSDESSEGESNEGESSEITESVSLVHFANHFGGGYTLFVCPGLQGAINDAGSDASSDASNDSSATADTASSDAPCCGRRVVRLYLARGRFLCRQCSQLVHITPYELPWQRALRRVNKLRRRLGVGPGVSTMVAAPPKPRSITVDRYEYLLDKLLWAELAVTEAQTAYFLQLAERIERQSPAQTQARAQAHSVKSLRLQEQGLGGRRRAENHSAAMFSQKCLSDNSLNIPQLFRLK
jgi:hypothetical protein